MSRAKTDLIVVHCAATPPSMDIGVKEIDRWHRARGWLMVGYHFVIKRDGTTETGRDIEAAGAHARGYNHRSIGICLVGGVAEDKTTPENNFTEEQFAALEDTLALCKDRWPDAEIIGHNEIASKACPSFDVQSWLREREGAVEVERCECCGQPLPTN